MQTKVIRHEEASGAIGHLGGRSCARRRRRHRFWLRGDKGRARAERILLSPRRAFAPGAASVGGARLQPRSISIRHSAFGIQRRRRRRAHDHQPWRKAAPAAPFGARKPRPAVAVSSSDSSSLVRFARQACARNAGLGPPQSSTRAHGGGNPAADRHSPV